MGNATYIRFATDDRSYFSIIKKELNHIAIQSGFDSQKLTDLDLIVSEMITNLQHSSGEILVGHFPEADNCYIELISIDHGSGTTYLKDFDNAAARNDLGISLAEIKRLSDKFDLYSLKGWGTIVLSRMYKTIPAPRIGPAAKIEIRPLVIAMPGQAVSGDGTCYTIDEQYFKLLVADGLGHGEEANYAVKEAGQAFKASTSNSPGAIIKDIHLSILRTRGIVGTVVVFDFVKKTWAMAGVGNISIRMSNFLGVKNLMSHNGIIGHNIPNVINSQMIPLNDYHQITLCSDGMKSRWELSKYEGINRCDLSIQAAAIYKDFARHTDDMSVVIAKINQL